VYLRKFIYHIHFSFKEELKHLYLFNSLKFVLLIVFSNFTLFYIYSFGLYKLLFYLLIFYLTNSLGVFLFIKLVNIFSVEQIFLFSFFLRIITLVLFFYIDPNEILHLILPAILQGFSNIMEWLITHYLLAFKSDKEKLSEERALIDIINYSSKVILPFLFGLLIDFFGFKAFYLFLSLVILFIAFYLTKKYKKSKRETIISLSIDNKIKNLILIFIVYDIAFFILFFVYILALFELFKEKSVTNFGSFLSISNLIVILLALLISKRIDRIKDYGLAVLGMFLGIEALIMLLFSSHNIITLMAIFIFPISLILVEIPYSTAYYLFIRNSNVTTYLFHQFSINFLRATFLFFLIVKNIDFKVLLLFSVFLVNLIAFIYYFFIKNFEIRVEENEIKEKLLHEIELRIRKSKNKEILKNIKEINY